MAAADVQEPPAEIPGLPDYVLTPNATLGDDKATWRHGRAPDYSNTRKVYESTKTMSHEAASLPNLVENLVKNWEVEASFKPEIEDWRTIDPPNYTFAINGGPPQTAEHMLKVGTYNAIITPNEYYDPTKSDFDSSHKTFKRMMPTFAWEVLEVYSGPPVVAFKWRHWGVMKSDYVGYNDKGEKITAKAHGGTIDIQGVTVAKVDDKLRLQAVDTWFDPLEMFRQISPAGDVTRTIHVPKPGEDITTQLHGEETKPESKEPQATPAVVIAFVGPEADRLEVNAHEPTSEQTPAIKEVVGGASTESEVPTTEHLEHNDPEPVQEEVSTPANDTTTIATEHSATTSEPTETDVHKPAVEEAPTPTSSEAKPSESIADAISTIPTEHHETEIKAEKPHAEGIPGVAESVAAVHAEMASATSASCPFLASTAPSAPQ